MGDTKTQASMCGCHILERMCCVFDYSVPYGDSVWSDKVYTFNSYRPTQCLYKPEEPTRPHKLMECSSSDVVIGLLTAVIVVPSVGVVVAIS